ncbi:Putative heavy-metal chelation domain protein [Acididesulfobacillus acetoxydans]|uniref:Heavy-metal chelation domain protein n=1 Tax=Acididesulfobacillus acetoxydans TaxID=1561005 RepID=A0A8S0WAA8_9FIRM|nr:DUF364 domain-containing protein [Acididesulfobacillus acetoxydans]CAA7603289.1 Putative heavy-metal chelation domain protein [Acididesulfobacillus acetoxydans]
MFLERIYDLALPRLAEKKVREVRIGLGLMGVELDDGSIGVTYVLRKETLHTCSALKESGEMVGRSAAEIAGWGVRGKNVITTALGLAVLNSVADFNHLKKDEGFRENDAVFSVDVRPTDAVGMIGHIGPLVSGLKSKARHLLIFERGEDVRDEIYPESAEPRLLPACQVVFVSSTSLINRTLEDVLSYCSAARDVVMVGSSTPLYPEAFKGSRVTMLSGTRWLPAHGEAILSGISQCAGIRQLIQYGQKISVRVPAGVPFQGRMDTL